MLIFLLFYTYSAFILIVFLNMHSLHAPVHHSKFFVCKTYISIQLFPFYCEIQKNITIELQLINTANMFYIKYVLNCNRFTWQLGLWALWDLVWWIIHLRFIDTIFRLLIRPKFLPIGMYYHMTNKTFIGASSPKDFYHLASRLLVRMID